LIKEIRERTHRNCAPGSTHRLQWAVGRMAQYGDGHLPPQSDALVRQPTSGAFIAGTMGIGRATVCPSCVAIAQDTAIKKPEGIAAK
jgi:hypothetical protein